MASGQAIRGSRIGAGPMGESDRGELAPRMTVTYYCCAGHESSPVFAAEAEEVPEVWSCHVCALPAGMDKDNPPPAPSNEPYKTHLAYVKERRSAEDGAALLEEALQALRVRRGELA